MIIILKRIKFFVLLYIRFAVEAVGFFLILARHNASSRTFATKEKLEFVILRETHVIEKGMSMRNPRKGFGQIKVLELLKELECYAGRYGDVSFLNYPLGNIGEYIRFSKAHGVGMDDIEARFLRLCGKCGILPPADRLCLCEVTKTDILAAVDGGYADVIRSRHSIRYFAQGTPDMKLVDAALELAQMTPSACNRQAWKSYVFSGDRLVDLLMWQGGARGFEKDVPMGILVTSNARGFLYYEPYQAYVDGGLYAMNLINALHSRGLGTVPLSTGFELRKIRQLHREFDIPNNEVPIVIIGFGNVMDEFRVAASRRKPVSQTTNYDNLSQNCPRQG